MLPGISFNTSIGLRPARGEDQAFFEQLFKRSLTALRMVDKDPDYIETVIDQQWRSREAYYQQMYPLAMYMVIEIQGMRAGRLVLDAGHNEMRVIDIHLVEQLRGKGYGTELLRGLQRASEISRTPLALVAASDNPRAMQLYRRLGFEVEESNPMATLLTWKPGNNPHGIQL